LAVVTAPRRKVCSYRRTIAVMIAPDGNEFCLE
jgi:hypothetical protein